MLLQKSIAWTMRLKRLRCLVMEAHGFNKIFAWSNRKLKKSKMLGLLTERHLNFSVNKSALNGPRTFQSFKKPAHPLKRNHLKSLHNLLSLGFNPYNINTKSVTIRPHQKMQKRLRLAREDSILRNVLTRWLIFWLGAPITFIFEKSLHKKLSANNLSLLAFLDFRISQYVANGDITKLGLWTGGPNIVLMSSLIRDPDLLISWLRLRLPRMSLFSHRRFFRLLGVLLSTLVLGTNKTMAGVNMYLVGKISVTGNAMSRSQLVKVGVGGNSNLRAQVVSGFTLVYTNTGCLGLTITYFYK